MSEQRRRWQSLRRRWGMVAGALVALGALLAAGMVGYAHSPSAGAKETRACTLMRGVDQVGVSMPEEVASRLRTVQVGVLQGGHGATVTFAAQPEQRVGSYALVGDPPITVVFREARSYLISLDQLEGSWSPDDRGRMAVVGYDRDGRPAVHARDSFTFDRWYPNGRDCDDPPRISHTMLLTRADAR